MPGWLSTRLRGGVFSIPFIRCATVLSGTNVGPSFRELRPFDAGTSGSRISPSSIHSVSSIITWALKPSNRYGSRRGFKASVPHLLHRTESEESRTEPLLRSTCHWRRCPRVAAALRCGYSPTTRSGLPFFGAMVWARRRRREWWGLERTRVENANASFDRLLF